MATTMVAAISAGMVASEDVQGPGGRVFLRRGETISERHVLALRALGITAVQARRADEESGRAATPAAVVQQLQADLLPRFRHNDLTHPAVKELFRLALLRRVRARLG
jgi:hypothetical protein